MTKNDLVQEGLNESANRTVRKSNDGDESSGGVDDAKRLGFARRGCSLALEVHSKSGARGIVRSCSE